MSKKMLIDASHPEETRVVIVDHNRVEELDFESRHKRQLRGNVYLARVTRVEPSLQAAFIEYGGNRHGFLAFSEIHPDYYQIPYEDRMALLEAEEEELEAVADEEEDAAEGEIADEEDRDENIDPDEDDAADESDAEVADEQAKVASTRRKRMSRRRYKIQEVIKRGQILLVQAVKEERGNKGAAMTTYLSLAGRYCVLMPNTPRGGGISRKIANGSDRKRLKSVMSEMEVPQGMGVIVRTAGAKRTKVEIKRDYEYLARLWSDIREETLKSIAPSLIHEEGNLVKRSIRDLYNKDIDEVLVEGEEAYKTAKAFIKMLMPSHAKFVKQYKEDIPLFLRYGVERQIENSLSPLVQLKSGGYLVIHPTEALVSIDVNSGRSTKERNVERTALKTNMEAAEEIARQMRLRDLAGLVVIDFIDMDEHKNNRAVERKMKDALTQDRARIQTSRISQFGLMEISRQRRRRSLLEGSTTSCPHCAGVGRKRTVESSALAAIRAVEETAIRGEAERIRLKVSPDVAFYLINEKRDLLTQVDQNGGVFTEVAAEEDLIRPDYEIEVLEKKNRKGPDPLEEIEKEFRRQRQIEQNAPKKIAPIEDKDEDEDADETETDTKVVQSETSEAERSSKRRGRRGRRGGRGRTRNRDENVDETSSKNKSGETSGEPESLKVIDPATHDEKPKSRRRRTRKAPARTSEAQDVTVSAETTPVPEAKKVDEDASKSRSSRRRRAPSKNKAHESKAVQIDGPVEQEERVTEKLKRAVKGTRRAAPSRKPKAEAREVSEEKPKSTRKTAAKKAPAKNAEIESTEKPKRTRKAPAKKATPKEAEPVVEEKTVAKASTRRRRAPTKPSTDVASAQAVKTKKAPAKRKAAAKKTSPKVEPEAEVTADKAADKPAAKTTRRRATPKKPAEAPQTEVVAAKPARSRKAPAKKAPAAEAELQKPEVKNEAPKAEPTAEIKTDSEAKPAKKKRGWWNRKK